MLYCYVVSILDFPFVCSTASCSAELLAQQLRQSLQGVSCKPWGLHTGEGGFVAQP